MGIRERYRRADPDWRAVAAGVLAAVLLAAVGLAGGRVAGGLLPGDCQGLACVYLHVLLLYSGALLALWGLIGTVTALARQRWPRSPRRVVVLRVLAGLSYVPVLWLIGTLAGVW